MQPNEFGTRVAGGRFDNFSWARTKERNVCSSYSRSTATHATSMIWSPLSRRCFMLQSGV